jgi:hypothetical protein
MNRRLGGTYHLHLQGKNQLSKKLDGNFYYDLILILLFNSHLNFTALMHVYKTENPIGLLILDEWSFKARHIGPLKSPTIFP